jgi:hypothetical protein
VSVRRQACFSSEPAYLILMEMCHLECMVEDVRLILFLLISVEYVHETQIEIYQGVQERFVMQNVGTWYEIHVSK